MSAVLDRAEIVTRVIHRESKPPIPTTLSSGSGDVIPPSHNRTALGMSDNEPGRKEAIIDLQRHLGRLTGTFPLQALRTIFQKPL